MKKGKISSLTLGVVFLLLTIAVGVTLQNIIQGPIIETEPCDLELDLRLAEISGKKQICYQNEERKLIIILENGVLEEINSLSLIINQRDLIDLNPLSFSKAEIKRIDLNYTKKIKSVEIVPSIRIDEQLAECAQETLFFERIPFC